MKKFAVIITMALSMAAMTACGNGDKESEIMNTGDMPEDQDTDANGEDNDKTDTEGTEDNNDNTDDVDKDNVEDTDNTGNEQESEKEDTDDEKETLIETGEEPDFELNEKGCFNGSYEGNDGCTYKFTKKGKLIITSDNETLKYQYTLNEDVLSMVSEDGSFGTSRRITLLEDGTYLLDDEMGTQVVLTYIEE